MPKPRPMPSHQNTQEVTKLTPEQELYFQLWARANKVADVDKPDSYYDYRGWWKANGPKPVQFGVDHFEDTWKQHGHPTFSQESKYSKGPGDGGMWRGDQFIPQFEMSPSHDQAYKEGEGLIDMGLKRLEGDKKNQLKLQQDEQKSIQKSQDNERKSQQKVQDNQVKRQQKVEDDKVKSQEKAKAAYPKKMGNLVSAMLEMQQHKEGNNSPQIEGELIAEEGVAPGQYRDPMKALKYAQGIGPTPATPQNGYKIGMMAPPVDLLSSLPGMLGKTGASTLPITEDAGGDLWNSLMKRLPQLGNGQPNAINDLVRSLLNRGRE
jgi:hypothetical protein